MNGKERQFEGGQKCGFTLQIFFQLPALSQGMLSPREYNVDRDCHLYLLFLSLWRTSRHPWKPPTFLPPTPPPKTLRVRCCQEKEEVEGGG